MERNSNSMRPVIRTILLLYLYLLSTGRVMPGQMAAWQQRVRTSERLQEDGRLTEAERVLLDILPSQSRLGADDLAYI